MPDGVPAKGSQLCMQESPTIYNGFLTPLYDLKYKMEWRSLGQYNIWYYNMIFNILQRWHSVTSWSSSGSWLSIIANYYFLIPCPVGPDLAIPDHCGHRRYYIQFQSHQSVTQFGATVWTKLIPAGNSVSAHHWHVGTTDHRRPVREWRHQCSRFKSAQRPNHVILY